jgi:DNA repair photolyase
MLNQKYKGRGSQSNPKNRFEKLFVDFENPDNDFHSDEENIDVQPGTTFYRDESKSVISKNNSKDLYFNYSFNPYRGCEHGCVYCYARPSHEFLGFSSGMDFETKIMTKEKAPQLLEEEFNKRSYKPEVIEFCGNTDCYQPVERRLGITRRALQVCLNYRNPVALITKNALVLRDIDILKEMAGLNLVSVMLSITTLDKELANKMEPRTSIPERRLKVIEEMAKNNIPAGVNIAPVIPALNDKEIPAILKNAADCGASFAGYEILRLPYSVKDLFIEWLKREMPDRAERVINSIKTIRGGKLNETEFGKRFTGEGELAETIRNLFNLSCRKYKLNSTRIKITNGLFRRNPANQLELF